ncbi:ABC transporter substrate-binding protein [Paenibacillus chondroitinus]|uniref:ABC transporter substrate-binding protein n=1 Tax=Paenibacillus chondroitinus TaxID=59842 RepID=A0ABU6D7T5_9BACL|nr:MULTISPECIES: ABC transporter substrate-binding protein [Paenibacillus]MCY9661698.1 ABC transporter substrate-binding protein [Paenibacillus anseongense]MEB4793783.1 ABC transporter substrate-binding protein [Paenibacillus chondroitinus]
MLKMKKTAIILFAAMLLTAATGCSSTTSSTTAPAAAADKKKEEALQTVKFSEVIRSVFYAPHYIAMEKGFFKEEGLNVDMNTAQGSDKGAAALIAGVADISLVGPETAIYIYNQKGDKTLKIFHQLTMKDGSFLLSRNKVDNFKWSDLGGKSVIGWRPGSAPQMVLNTKLTQEKVAQTDVVTNIASTAMAGAFTSGKGDYIQVFEPIASSLVKEGKAHYVASVGQDFGAFPETSYVATSDYIKKNPAIIQKFVNAVAKGRAWMQTASSDDIASALMPFFDGTPKDIIIQSVDRYMKQDTWPAVPELNAQQFDTLQKVLIENGVLKPEQKVADINAVVDMSFVKKIGKAE